MLKHALCAELQRAMAGRRQSAIAFELRIDGNRVAELARGDLRRFSTESLIRFLDRSGYAVTFTAVKRPR